MRRAVLGSGQQESPVSEVLAPHGEDGRVSPADPRGRFACGKWSGLL